MTCRDCLNYKACYDWSGGNLQEDYANECDNFKDTPRAEAYKNEYNRLFYDYSKLKKENDDLFYKLQGVMWFVDKWLDGDELKQDEVNRAITMREKTLQIVEEKQAEIDRLKSMNQAKLDTIHDLMAEIEKLNHPILIADNVEIDKEELLEKLQQSQLQPLPIEKQYEIRDCPFSPFDEYCTGNCVNCENRLECVDCSKRLKSKAIEEFLDKFDKRCLDGGIFPGFIRNLLGIVKDDMVGEQNG